jgi:hypothetical protein
MPKHVASRPWIRKWGVLSYYVPEGLIHPEDVGHYLSAQDRGEENASQLVSVLMRTGRFVEM